MYKAAIITASDKGSQGLREDASGELIKGILIAAGYEVVEKIIVPDERLLLSREIIKACDELGAHLVLTTGGTGFSKRDITPEATRDVIEREAPGIAEAMRYYSIQITPKGMLSRGIAGIRGNSLIVNLPGSPKAVKETLEYIIHPVYHGLQILVGDDSECARPL